MFRDLREVFKYEFWQQGYMLFTRNTERIGKDWQKAAQAREQRTAFAFFTPLDEGRSREFVFEFDNADQCKAAVEAHNAELAKLGAAKREELARQQREKFIQEAHKAAIESGSGGWHWS